MVAIQNEGQTTLGTTEVNTVGTELPSNTTATTSAKNNSVDVTHNHTIPVSGSKQVYSVDEDIITVSGRKQGTLLFVLPQMKYIFTSQVSMFLMLTYSVISGGGIESTLASGIATLLPSFFSVYMSAILILTLT